MSTSEPCALTRVTPVITGELKSKIDRVWDAFWSAASATRWRSSSRSPTWLFIRRLDDIQTLAEKKARVTADRVEKPCAFSPSLLFGAARATPEWMAFIARRRGVPAALGARVVMAPPTAST